MKKTGIFLLAVLCVCFSLASCASDKVEERPLWTDDFTVSQVFPSSEFVTGIGRSTSAANATVLSDGELAAYFTRQITAVTKGIQKTTNAGGLTDDRQIVKDVTITSNIKLFAVNHTTPWFSKDEGVWYCCAYLNRKEAWKIYEAVVIQYQKEFLSFYESAEFESDAFKKIQAYREASKAGENYSDVLTFAEILYKSGCTKYSADRTLIASIDEKIMKARNSIIMKVEVRNDRNNRYYNAAAKVLSSLGVSVSETHYAYKVLVEVDENKQKFTDTLVANPVISISVSDGVEKILSENRVLDRVTGFIEAESLVNSKISTAVEKEIAGPFAASFADLF